jgi:hypothetical protein
MLLFSCQQPVTQLTKEYYNDGNLKTIEINKQIYPIVSNQSKSISLKAIKKALLSPLDPLSEEGKAENFSNGIVYKENASDKNAYYDLDLSSYTGGQQALVCIEANIISQGTYWDYWHVNNPWMLQVPGIDCNDRLFIYLKGSTKEFFMPRLYENVDSKDSNPLPTSTLLLTDITGHIKFTVIDDSNSYSYYCDMGWDQTDPNNPTIIQGTTWSEFNLILKWYSIGITVN